METTDRKPRAITGCARQDSPGVLARAKVMYAAILLSVAQFPNLPIAMAAFLGLIQSFDAAQGTMKAKPRGLASARDTRRDAVWTAMQTLRTYVQSLADGLSAPEATALIELAGLLVAGVPIRLKPFLEAKPTTLPGVVHIIANRSLLVGGSTRSVTFNWQWSIDGKSWSSLPSTPLADTEMTGLTPLTTYYFRVSVTISRVAGEWSEDTSVMLLH
jgi:hypothetical protein